MEFASGGDAGEEKRGSGLRYQPFPNGRYAYATRIIATEMLEDTERPNEILRELVGEGQTRALYYLLTAPDPALPSNYRRAVRLRNTFKRPITCLYLSATNLNKRSGLQVWGLCAGIARTFTCMWILFYWVSAAADEKQVDGAVLDEVKPPYNPLLESWLAA